MPQRGLEQGSDVVLVMIEKCDLTKGSIVAMDIFFTTLPLFDELMEMGMYGVGTVQENWLQEAPLKKKATFQKEIRVTFDYTFDENNLFVAWRDDKVVIVATNCLSQYPVSSTKRWSKAEKKHVDIRMPNPFNEYNANMEVLIYLTVSFHLSCANPFEKVVVAFSQHNLSTPLE